MRKFWSSIIVLCFLLACSSCKNKLELDDNGVPETLVIGVFAGDDPELVGKRLRAIGVYLEKKLGVKKVEYIQTNDYTAVVEALHSKKVHMAQLSPFSYVLATKKGGIYPLVAMGDSGKMRSYRSVIITHKNTGLKTMDDVKARANDLTLSFSDPASTSGHMVPRAYLTSIGLDPQTSFKQTLFASSNGASLLTVLAGKVDIGCCWENAISIYKNKGIVKGDEITVLWRSEPMISSPIVIRDDINKDFVKKIKQAYLDLNEEAPEIFQEYLKLYYVETKNFGYVPAYDSMYNGIREIAGGIKDINFAQ